MQHRNLWHIAGFLLLWVEIFVCWSAVTAVDPSDCQEGLHKQPPQIRYRPGTCSQKSITIYEYPCCGLCYVEEGNYDAENHVCYTYDQEGRLIEVVSSLAFIPFRSPTCDREGWHAHFTCTQIRSDGIACDYQCGATLQDGCVIPSAYVTSQIVGDASDVQIYGHCWDYGCTIPAAVHGGNACPVSIPSAGHHLTLDENDQHDRKETCTQYGYRAACRCDRQACFWDEEVRTWVVQACTYQKEAAIIPPHGDAYRISVILQEADCTTAGIVHHMCTQCDEWSREEQPPYGHHEVVESAVAATCVQAGKTAWSYCDVCHLILCESRVIEPNDDAHILIIDPAREPTCEQNGVTQGTHCSVCAKIITEQTQVPALGHRMGSLQILSSPEIGVAGEGRVTCTVCAFSMVVRLEPLPEPPWQTDYETAEVSSGDDPWDTCGRVESPESSEDSTSVDESSEAAQSTDASSGPDITGTSAKRDPSKSSSWSWVTILLLIGGILASLLFKKREDAP